MFAKFVYLVVPILSETGINKSLSFQNTSTVVKLSRTFTADIGYNMLNSSLSCLPN